MNRRRDQRGYSLIEVMLSLAVLATGALVALTVMSGTAQQNEVQKGVSLGYKSSQDVMEALLSMSWADLDNLYSYQQGPPAHALTFLVTAPGFPRLNGGGYVSGTYTLTDVSDQYGWAAGSRKVYEIDIRVDHQIIHVRIASRRLAP